MASHALLMIGCLESWNKDIGIVKRFSMTACASGWLNRDRAVVMAALANGSLVHMEITGEFAVFDVFQKSFNDLPMG